MNNDAYIEGYATPKGTRNFGERAVGLGVKKTHFKVHRGLTFSSIGMGTYLGQPNNVDDQDMENAIIQSVTRGGINVIDTAINYRAMKSEKSIGRALKKIISQNISSRDEIFVCTKNGYITNDADYPSVDVIDYIYKMYISNDVIRKEDISSGYHVMNPNYIKRCIDKSLQNTGLKTIDLVYIHNSFESWNKDVSKEEYLEMLRRVFEVYENYRSEGKIRYYGMATWTCFRVKPSEKDFLSLEQISNLAKDVGGENNGFAFIQFPYNMQYNEALSLKNQQVGGETLTLIEAAQNLGIGIFSSIPLLQGRLLHATISDFAGLQDNVLKLLQFVRSTPGIIAPLVGQKKNNHVIENLKISYKDPLTLEQFRGIAHELLQS